MAYNESEWSDWHTFSATTYLYDKSGGNWEQIIASDSRVDIVVKVSMNHQFLRLIASSAGKIVLNTVVPPLSDWAKTSQYFAQLQLNGTIESGPKAGQNVNEMYGFSFDGETLQECNTKMMQAIAVLRKNSKASSAKTVNVTDWLAYLGMKQYADSFIAEGFNTIDSILRIDDEDLDDLGVVMGHKKIILAAVKKLRVHLDGSAPASSPKGDDAAASSSAPAASSSQKLPTTSAKAVAKPQPDEDKPPPVPLKKNSKTKKKVDFANMTISKPVGVVRKMHISFDLTSSKFKNVPKEWLEMGFHRQFGVELAHCPKKKVPEYESPIPAILVYLKEKWIESDGPMQEGIFRLAPSKDECQQVRTALDRGESPDTIKPHIAATLIKQWFRALPKGLLNATNQALIAQAAKNMCTIESVVDRLPLLQRCTFMWCLDVLNIANDNSEHNFMNRRNLSICMSPNLWKHAADADPMVALDFSSKVCEFVEKAMEHRGKQLEALKAAAAAATPEPEKAAAGADTPTPSALSPAAESESETDSDTDSGSESESSEVPS